MVWLLSWQRWQSAEGTPNDRDDLRELRLDFLWARQELTRACERYHTAFPDHPYPIESSPSALDNDVLDEPRESTPTPNAVRESAGSTSRGSHNPNMDGNMPFAHNRYNFGRCNELIISRRRRREHYGLEPPSDAELVQIIRDTPAVDRYMIARMVQEEREERSWAFYRIGCISFAQGKLSEADYQILLELGGRDAILEQAAMRQRPMEQHEVVEARKAADTELNNAAPFAGLLETTANYVIHGRCLGPLTAAFRRKDRSMAQAQYDRAIEEARPTPPRDEARRDIDDESLLAAFSENEGGDEADPVRAMVEYYRGLFYEDDDCYYQG